MAYNFLKAVARTLHGAGEWLVSTFSRRKHAPEYRLLDFAITLFGILVVWLVASALVPFLLARIRGAAFRIFVSWLGLPRFFLTPLDLLGTALDTALFLALPLSVASVIFFAFRRSPAAPARDGPPRRDDPGDAHRHPPPPAPARDGPLRRDDPDEMERRILVRVRQRGGDLSVSALAGEWGVPEDAVREAVERLASRGLIAMD